MKILELITALALAWAVAYWVDRATGNSNFGWAAWCFVLFLALVIPQKDEL